MMGDSKKSLCARIDLRPNMNLPDGATLGSDVEIIIKGKVTALRGATMDSYKDSKGKTIESIYPGELKVEVSSVAIGAVGEYDGMEDD
jgi:hypothetical protein